MDKPFQPKGADVLRSELITELGLAPENETNKEIIEKLVARELKNEEFKASLHKQKTNAKKQAKDLFKAKEFYKTGGKKADKSKGTKDENKDKNEDLDTLVSEKVYLKQGGTNTEVRMIKQVMKAFGINFDKASQHKVFLTWKKTNDEENEARKAQLGPSRGGKPASKDVKMTDKDKEFLEAMGVKKK